MKKCILFITLTLCMLNVAQLRAENETEQQNKPRRTEKKSFTNVSQLDINHQYGNIVIRESSSSQVDVEIQYFDDRSEQASCTLSSAGNKLSIKTKTIKSNSDASINYIISLPRNTALTTNLKYGNMKVDSHQGAFNLNLSYGDLDVQSFTNVTSSITVEYGDIKIGEAKDVTISSMYSDIKMIKANKVNLKGSYGDYKFEDVHTVTSSPISYSDLKIATVRSVSLNLEYGDLVIDNLVSDANITASFTDVKITARSPRLDNININGNYSDTSITLSSDISATFDLNSAHGDIDIAKNHIVKYTQQSEQNNIVIKRGQIGTKNPTAKIVVSSNYADIKLK